MIENLLEGKRVLIVGHYNTGFSKFLNKLNEISDTYFLSITFTPALRRRIFRLNKLIVKENTLSNDKKLATKINKKMDELNPDVTIVPSNDYLIKLLSKIRHRSNTVRKINERLLSKKFQKKFRRMLNIPTIDNLNNTKFPLVLKPIYGSGARNVFLARNKAELIKRISFYKSRNIEFVIQNFIPKNFFAVYNLFILDKKITGFVYYNNDSKDIIIRKFLLKNIIKFLNKTKIEGFVSFQCRIKNDKIYTLEINPRIHHLTPDVYNLFTEVNNGRFMIKTDHIEIKKVRISERILGVYIEKQIISNHIKTLTEDFNPSSFIINTPRILSQIFYKRFILPKKHF